MNQFETNVISSFKEVRKDILELKGQLLSLAESQEKLDNLVHELERKKVKKVVKKRK